MATETIPTDTTEVLADLEALGSNTATTPVAHRTRSRSRSKPLRTSQEYYTPPHRRHQTSLTPRGRGQGIQFTRPSTRRQDPDASFYERPPSSPIKPLNTVAPINAYAGLQFSNDDQRTRRNLFSESED